MKKIIGYLLSHACFYIGDFASRISVIKIKGKFLWDKNKFTGIVGSKIFDVYQNFMHYSLKIQDWAGNESPWKKPAQKDIDTILG